MIFTILIILVCVLLIMVILVQNSKGGGIQSQFGAATQIMGVKRGTEFIEKATWGLAIALIFLSVLMAPKNSANTASTEDSKSVTKEKAQNAVAPVRQQPAAPSSQQLPPAPKPQ